MHHNPHETRTTPSFMVENIYRTHCLALAETERYIRHRDGSSHETDRLLDEKCYSLLHNYSNIKNLYIKIKLLTVFSFLEKVT